MKKRHTFFYHISMFVVAQLLWLMLLGLWIYWYVSNYIIFNKVGDKLSPQIIYDGTNVVALVGGIILLVAISFIMSLIFRHLNVQLKLTNLYDNFIANITHELKSPLSSIQLYLETLNTRKVPEQKQKEFLGLMIKDADRLKNLINTILEVSSLEQKKIAHNYQVYQTGELIEELFAETSEQFKLPERTIEIKGKPECKCVVDVNAFRIIFNNLVDNSIKYSDKPLKISVDAKCNTKNISIDFSDNGIGIPINEQKKIFNKFYRIYNHEIPNVKGTGLGLYWVKEIIKTHGGKISVFSEGSGKGTTFKIELPIYQQTKKHFINNLLKKTIVSKKKEPTYE